MHSRTAEHAAISSIVELVRELDKPWADKLANGLLRKVQREMQDSASELNALLGNDLSIAYAQPKWFVKALQKAWPEKIESILSALQERAPMTLRVNTHKVARDDYLNQLATSDIQAEPLAEVPSALVLDKPMGVFQLPGFDEGLVSIQDAGAQLSAELLDLHAGQRVLDACAAPGGKSMHLAQHQPEVTLTACDIDEQRLERVAQNAERCGVTLSLQVLDVENPPQAWRDQPFDRILLDAPCSATGVMRRHPDVRMLRRATDIEDLAVRQAKILDSLWECLAPGGKLLYVTCSLMPKENEQQIQAFMERQPGVKVIPIDVTWGHTRAIGRQTLPGEMTMDGFFYALLEKTNATTA
jgi:16S rRNA (cytosine967-C5)-methyltransferase